MLCDDIFAYFTMKELFSQVVYDWCFPHGQDWSFCSMTGRIAPQVTLSPTNHPLTLFIWSWTDNLMWKKKNKSGGVVVYVFALGHNFSCRMETDPGEGNAIVVFLKNYHQIW